MSRSPFAGSGSLDARLQETVARWSSLRLPEPVLCLGAEGAALACDLGRAGVAARSSVDAPPGGPAPRTCILAPSSREASATESAEALVAPLPASVERVLFVAPRALEGGKTARASVLEALGRLGLRPAPPFDAPAVGTGTVLLARVPGEVAPADILLDELEARLTAANGRLRFIERSVGWRFLAAIRDVRRRLAPSGSWLDRAYRSWRQAMGELVERGPGAFFGRIWRAVGGEPARYAHWRAEHERALGDAAALRARAEALPSRPLVSVLAVVRDAAAADLRAGVASLRAQAYEAWELVLVDDGSTAPHVKPLLEALASEEKRIRVERPASALGPAAAAQRALELARGDLAALLEPGDRLSPDALLEAVSALAARPEIDAVYSDEDRIDARGRRSRPFFKPSWDPVLLLGTDYAARLFVARADLLRAAGGFRAGADAARDLDLVLRATERARGVGHVARVLYHRRDGAPAVPEEAAARAVADALARRGERGRVSAIAPGLREVRYEHDGEPLVSILIPTRDRHALVEQCLRSIEERSSYRRFEVIVIDNGSADPESLRYLASLGARARVVRDPRPFNFPALNNLGAREARGELLLFLNNDTEVISRDWLEEMIGHARRPEVGGVGAKLLYPDGRIQHGGVTLGTGGMAGHAFKLLRGDRPHHFGLSDLARSVSCVTAACMLMRKDVFEKIGGYDERFRVAFNDVDLCLRILAAGYRIVQAGQAVLRHHESATRQAMHPPEDEQLLMDVWGRKLAEGDPYFPAALPRTREDWRLD